jgi:hypothetical protein
MRFDEEGHVIVTPKEIHDGAIADPGGLINQVLLPGTPLAFPTHRQHCDLLNFLADRLGVHPRNLLFKGSTKIGFSIAPRAEKVWMRYGPASDLDLAVIDQDYFRLVDGQVRMWERKGENRNRMFQDRKLLKAYQGRNHHRGTFDCLRFFDLPEIPCMMELYSHLSEAPVENCCEYRRGITAFIFRDWWAVYHRYDFDLYKLRTSGLSPPDLEAKPYQELMDADGGVLADDDADP